MTENKFNISLGCDPEIFVENENEVVSAEGLTNGGSKYEPKKIPGKEEYMIQEDGVALEFNIPPSTTREDFANHIEYVLDYFDVLVKSKGLSLSKKVSYYLNPAYLKTPQATTFGCEPDYNVYLKGENEPPNNNTNLRVVGGHVHIGFPMDEMDSDQILETQENIVKMFDIFLVLPSLIKDKDTERRKQYGKAGSFRFKDFGVECRALSNFWIHNREDIYWVFDQAIKAVNLVLENNHGYYIENFSERVKNCIDNHDTELAFSLIEEIEKKELIKK